MKGLHCLVAVIACGLALGPERPGAQRRTTVAVDATVGVQPALPTHWPVPGPHACTMAVIMIDAE